MPKASRSALNAATGLSNPKLWSELHPPVASERREGQKCSSTIFARYGERSIHAAISFLQTYLAWIINRMRDVIVGPVACHDHYRVAIHFVPFVD